MQKYKLFRGSAAPAEAQPATDTTPVVASQEPPATGIASGNTAAVSDAVIMMIDDEPINMEIVQAYLETAGYSNFITTSESTSAMEIVKQELPDVILLDLVMPEVSGFDILEQLKRDDSLVHIPVIVLTSSNDSETKLKALQFGATDFLAKPVDTSELMLRLRNTLRAKAYQDHLIYYDSLTGLPNRRRFADRLMIALERAKQTNECGAILHIDLDRFKRINDTLGHSVGDKLLQVVAVRLELRIRDGDALGKFHDADARASLSRLGGDEYTIMIPRLARPENAAHVARRILAAMEEPFQVNGNELFVTPSIGISIFPDDGDNIDTLLKHADIAMYHAKQHGRNGFEFYSREMNSRSLERLNLENDLRNALDNNELQLYYQPKLDVKSGRITGAEALLRWEHPELGMVSPVEFIPLAEESGLIVPIGTWVLEMACSQAMAWQAAGHGSLKIAVNVSVRQFNEPALISVVKTALANSGLQSENLTLELTENMLMDGAESNIERLHLLKEIGVKLSIDDFGTGYSSLSYLQRFTIDELKIDMSFIKQIQTETDKAPIVDAVIAMAHNLSLDIVAEGVETGLQLEYLRQRGCGVYQGYLFSKPVPAARFAELLAGTAPAE